MPHHSPMSQYLCPVLLIDCDFQQDHSYFHKFDYEKTSYYTILLSYEVINSPEYNSLHISFSILLHNQYSILSWICSTVYWFHLYNRYIHFLVCLSFPYQVPAKHDLTMLFGPVVPDGYGICYNPQSDHFNFSVTAFNTSPETDSDRFADGLRDSLLEMSHILVTAPPAAKL